MGSGPFDFIGDIGTAVATPIAAMMQRTALQNAQNTQRGQYQQDQGYYQPYYSAGTGALGQLSTNLQNGAYNVNVTPQNLAGDPGYQFQLQQGQQALERSAAAHGGLMSGAFMKGLDQYSQGLASTQYQNAWNRQFQQNQMNYNQLANLAGMGERSAGSLANLGQNYGNTMAGYDLDLGNINAGAVMGQTQAGARGIAGAGNAGLDIGSAIGGMPGGLGGLGGGGGGNFNAGYMGEPMQAIPSQGYPVGGSQSLGSIGYVQPIPGQDFGGGYGYGAGYGTCCDWGGYP